jgi:hypothetical protein
MIAAVAGGSFSHLYRLLWIGLIAGGSGRLKAPVVVLRCPNGVTFSLMFCKHCRSGVVINEVIVLVFGVDGLLNKLFMLPSMFKHLRTIVSRRLLSGVFDELMMSFDISEQMSVGICASSSKLSMSISSM